MTLTTILDMPEAIVSCRKAAFPNPFAPIHTGAFVPKCRAGLKLARCVPCTVMGTGGGRGGGGGGGGGLIPVVNLTSVTEKGATV
jgi:hypothetical protein